MKQIIPLLSPLQHMTLRTSPLALESTTEPVRVHKHRRTMTAAYHQRIQKKWLKRWGVVQKPCIFKFSPAAVDLPGSDYFICHPLLEPQIRAALTLGARQQTRGMGILGVLDCCA